MSTSRLAMVVAAITLVSFAFSAPKPKLYDQINTYYGSLKNVPVEQGHAAVVHDLTAAITDGIATDKKVSVIFTCPDNSFRSQEAQILLQSLCAVNQLKRLSVLSTGYTVYM